MRRFAVVLLLLVISTATPICQAQSSDVPSREDVLQLMTLLNVKSQTGLLLDGMFGEFARSFKDSLNKRVPNATPDQQKLIREFVEGMQSDMRSILNVDELIEEMVPSYQKHLTKEEVKALVDFYSSPVGQSFLKKMPAIMKDGMQIGGDYARKRQEVLEEKIDIRMKDFDSKLKALQKQN